MRDKQEQPENYPAQRAQNINFAHSKDWKHSERKDADATRNLQQEESKLLLKEWDKGSTKIAPGGTMPDVKGYSPASQPVRLPPLSKLEERGDAARPHEHNVAMTISSSLQDFSSSHHRPLGAGVGKLESTSWPGPLPRMLPPPLFPGYRPAPAAMRSETWPQIDFKYHRSEEKAGLERRLPLPSFMRKNEPLLEHSQRNFALPQEYHEKRSDRSNVSGLEDTPANYYPYSRETRSRYDHYDHMPVRLAPYYRQQVSEPHWHMNGEDGHGWSTPDSASRHVGTQLSATSHYHPYAYGPSRYSDSPIRDLPALHTGDSASHGPSYPGYVPSVQRRKGMDIDGELPGYASPYDSSFTLVKKEADAASSTPASASGHSSRPWINGKSTKGKAVEPGAPEGIHKRGGKLPKPVTNMLKSWLLEHAEHPYPTEEDKRYFCTYTGLDICQVSNWFVNARRRILAPQVNGNTTNSNASGSQ